MCKEFLHCWKELVDMRKKNLTMDEGKEEGILEGLKIHPAGVTRRAL